MPIIYLPTTRITLYKKKNGFFPQKDFFFSFGNVYWF